VVSTDAISPAAKIGWSIAIVATLYVCYFSQLGVLGFVGPDEPRYAWIARAMAETGDWVTPRLYGQPWFEKPVLYYWSAALSFKLFGVSEAAARLPSALSASFATLALAWLALRIYGAATARWLLLLLPSSVGMIGFSHAAATDMPFSGMLTIAMVCAAAALELTHHEHTAIPPRTKYSALLLFGFFLGLAVLAKGPAAIILCGGALLFWAIFTKRWRDALRLLHPAAVVAFCATALPWYILCARRNADFFRVFIIEHNFKRYLTPEFQHVQPFWFYLPVLLAAFLPWTATLLWSASVGAKHWFQTRRIPDASILLICWAGFCILFFSTSHSKLPGYILPAFPPVGLLIARSCVSLAPDRRFSFRVAHFSAAALLFLALTLTAGFTFRGNVGFAGVAIAVAAFAIANLLLGVFFVNAEPRNAGRAVAAMAVTPMLIALLLARHIVPFFFYSDPSGRTIARELQQRQIPAEQLSVAMKRSMQYSLNFYMHQEIKSWDENTATGGYLLTNRKDCQHVVRPRFVCQRVAFDENDATGEFLFRLLPAGSAAGLPIDGQVR
jgi:4-amino-4-deoxy-L-arabinose transferase-like glycosyltransferase